MNGKTLHYSRKLRQFRYRTKKLNRWIRENRLQDVPKAELQKLIRQVKALYQELKGAIHHRRLRRMLAAAALLIGLGTASQAQTFADPVTNPFGFSGTGSFPFPTLVDIDADGDMDFFMSDEDSGLNFELRFFQNTGDAENPAFAAAVTTPFGVTEENLSRPTFGDLDNDGDLDMMTGRFAAGVGEFLYFENTGTATDPAFAAPVINPYNLTANTVLSLSELVDLDNDGDLDLMTSEYSGNMQYYENTGTTEAPSFTGPVQNPYNLIAPILGTLRHFDFVDLDKDGDLDMFYQIYSVLANQNKIYYAQNTGTPEAPAYENPQVDPFDIELTDFYSSAPVCSDIDFDGDVDVMLAQGITGLILYENTSNARPLSADTTLMTDQNTAYTFAAGDFPYSDDNGDAFGGVRIMSLPAAGTLTYDGVPVEVGQDVLAADIGLLVFTPETDESGPGYASFDFRIWDGMAMSADAYTVTFDVISGRADRLSLIDWSLSPNPTPDQLNLRAQLPAGVQELQLSVYDQAGRILQTMDLSVVNDRLDLQLNVSDLVPGQYYLGLQADGRQISLPFIKQ